MAAADQLRFLMTDWRRLVGEKPWRIWSAPFSASGMAVAAYRVDRMAYLALGPVHQALRVVLAPLLALLRPWLGRCEISYRADIGPGLQVIHPALGAVVGRSARIGAGLTLVGGNCLGDRPGSAEAGGIELGDDVTLGAGASVLGPVRLGDGVTVAAGAVVLDSADAGSTLVGVPARRVGGGQPGPPASTSS